MKFDITQQPLTLSDIENRKRILWRRFYYCCTGLILSIIATALTDNWEQVLFGAGILSFSAALFCVFINSCDIDYINTESCAIVAGWLPKYPVLASYMRSVNMQQRELTAAEYFAMATYVDAEEIKEKKAVLYKSEYNSGLQ